MRASDILDNLALCKLGSSPELLPKDIHTDRPKNARHTQTSKQRNALVDTQIDEQRPRKDDTLTGYRRSPDPVPCKERSRVLRVREGNVDGDALQGEEVAHGENAQPRERHGPVDFRVCGPREHEQANREQKRPEDGRHERVFLLTEPVLQIARHHVEVQVGEVDEQADQKRRSDRPEMRELKP